MKIALKTMLALGVAAMTAAATQAGAAEKVYGVEIAPGGKHYAVYRDAGQQRAISIYATDDAAAAPKGVGLGPNQVEDWEWGSDDYLLVRVAGETRGVETNTGLKTLAYSRWVTLDRQTGEFRTLFGNAQGNDYRYLITSAGVLVSTLPQSKDRALFARSFVAVKPSGPTRFKDGDDELLYSLFEANLGTGDSKRNAEGSKNTVDWIVTSSGVPLARIDQSEASKNVEIFAADDSGKGFKNIGSIPGKTVEAEEIKFLGRGSSPRTIQVVKTGAGGLQLFDYNLDTGAFGPPIPTPGPITRANYDQREARARLVYYTANGGERPFHLDADDQATQAKLEKALAGASVAIVSKSIDGARMIARADYADKPEEYYFFDKVAKRLELVAAN